MEDENLSPTRGGEFGSATGGRRRERSDRAHPPLSTRIIYAVSGMDGRKSGIGEIID